MEKFFVLALGRSAYLARMGVSRGMHAFLFQRVISQHVCHYWRNRASLSSAIIPQSAVSNVLFIQKPYHIQGSGWDCTKWCLHFVSQLFTGSISDREVTERSGILNLLHYVPYGKSIMADRGFDVQDLLAKFDILLNIPAFRNSPAAHLEERAVVATQKIARVRIHV